MQGRVDVRAAFLSPFTVCEGWHITHTHPLTLTLTLTHAQIINSTLGKALGGASGGYTAASREVTETLRNKARPYLFSNTVAPAVVRAVLAGSPATPMRRTA